MVNDWSKFAEFDSIKLLVHLETTSSGGSGVHVVARIRHWQYVFRDVFGYKEEDLPLSLLPLIEDDNPPELLASIPDMLMEKGEHSTFLKIKAADGRVFMCHVTFVSQPILRSDEELLREGFQTHAVSVMTIRRADGEGESSRVL